MEIIALSFFAIFLSSAIRFLIGFEFGLLAFWTNRATAIYSLYEGIHLFLAGRLAPLSMFPSWVEKTAAWLPFYGTVGFPVELLTGKLELGSSEIFHNFAIQLIWLIVLLVMFVHVETRDEEVWRCGRMREERCDSDQILTTI